MTGTDDNEEIAREAVTDGGDQRHPPAHPERQPEDEESYHHHRQQIGRRRESEPHDSVDPAEEAPRRIVGRNLERWHTREERAGPERLLAGSLGIGFRLLAYGDTLLGVVLPQHISLGGVGIEIDKSHHRNDDHRRQRQPQAARRRQSAQAPAGSVENLAHSLSRQELRRRELR